MSAPELDGPADPGAYDAKMIAEIRAHRPMMTGHVVRLDLEELDALLRAAAERDELKAAAVEVEATAAERIRPRSGAWCRYCGHYIVSDAGAPWRHLAPAAETGYHLPEPKA